MGSDRTAGPARGFRSPSPAEPAPAPTPPARKRRLGVATIAVVTAILTAAVTDAVTGVLTNGLRGGWERVTGGESLVLNVRVPDTSGEGCGDQWLLPAGAGPVPSASTGPVQLPGWARGRGGTVLPAPAVELTVRGRTGDVVVLRELRAVVVERRPVPAGDVVTVACGGDLAVRTFVTDLDAPAPVLRPLTDGDSATRRR